ncbi:MAG: proteasome accessory factor PafA2 family protein [Armatimonadetes bacterium]|nr:proteasome accessory factor PafA2 family protein [Armatimonadota bacterium]
MSEDRHSAEPDAGVERCPKICGADMELGNFILGMERANGTGYEASRALLREVRGVSGREYGQDAAGGGWESRYGTCSAAPGSYSQDWGRKFLAGNGGCIYIDLNHLELCLPEVTGARDWLACWHAMLRIARRAAVEVNEKLGGGRSVQVLANNSDGLGNAYGSHMNFLIPRRTWDGMFNRKLHQLLFLAAYQASSIVFAGQGKVGFENGTEPAAYQLSQRADFFEHLTGVQTTSHRPIVNSRDEPLCGPHGSADGALARLHCIFYDSNMCHAANYLKTGVMQIVLSMIEAEVTYPNLALDDAVEAVVKWSHDPGLTATARTASGDPVTAVELQMRFCEMAARFVESGGCDGLVPEASSILDLWGDTLAKLKANDMDSLMPRLDWVLKLSLIERAMDEYSRLDWDSPETRRLDLAYSNLDPFEGLYWACENAGLVERLVTDEEIESFTENPPEDTRAYTRAMLLRTAGPGVVDRVDWDSVRFRMRTSGWWPEYRTLNMPSPIRFTKRETGGLFEGAPPLDEILDALGATDPDGAPERRVTYVRTRG